MSNLYQYYEEMRKKGTILYFNGPVSQSMVEGLAELMREKMRAEEAGLDSVQRVFSILVEQMQNIVRYSSERHHLVTASLGEMAYGQVAVGRESDGSFFVACGNKVRAEDVERLTCQLEILRTMGRNDLKAYYRERRRSRPGEGSKGAGLGFIEMARKSSRPMDYDFVPLDCETAFFSMKVVAQ
ncbi:MAG: SiaB family protein kinase [Desulfovibrio sp.]